MLKAGGPSQRQEVVRYLQTIKEMTSLIRVTQGGSFKPNMERQVSATHVEHDLLGADAAFHIIAS